MASTKFRVVVCGASGQTGRSIMDQLLASPGQFETVDLARPESVSKEIRQDFARRGAVVKEINVNDTQVVPTLLTVADVVISCLIFAQKAEAESLIDASHKACVGCKGPEEFQHRRKRLYLPYTAMDVGFWYQVSIPRVPSGRLNKGLTFPDDVLLGDGNTRTILTDIADIGKYVVRIISDPCTLNRLVCAYNEVTTQNKFMAPVEELSGETIPKKYQSKGELEEIISPVANELAQNPNNGGVLLKKFVMYPEHAKYLGYLDANELYPDVEYATAKEFIRQLLKGGRDAVLYYGRDFVVNRD
ncbi:hypothetical protein PpBr36_01107 [Pyricularia pennisetigena]|uniref:hypothetical protein n=1 Tax=Pyricularia pennisetigena TaxID=1578925 RepID=UPI0011540C8F|nr:hypothetical protein PpBr36_01107 [Pyricularia pennisetigena]TLS28404.1 hypothetical protein PpBr36_01107 [Pyricularia pennisetigena]